jgi:hypothetical protein
VTSSRVFDSRTVGLAGKWAAIYMAMTLGWALLGKALGMHDVRIQYNLLFNTAVVIPSFPIYLWAIREMTGARPTAYGRRVVSGLLLTGFITVLGPLNPVISMRVISPQFFENAIRYVVDSGMMREAEARQQFNLTAFVAQGFIGGPIFGLVLSLIVAIVPRSRRDAAALAAGGALCK